jgi:hypothetical protein
LWLSQAISVSCPGHFDGEVSNFFDRRYATFGTFSQTSEVFLAEAPGAANPRSYTPGAPRRWLVGMKAQF